MSKGSRQRPRSIPKDQFDQNWDNIFNKQKSTEAEQQEAAWLKDEYYDLDQDDRETN